MLALKKTIARQQNAFSTFHRGGTSKFAIQYASNLNLEQYDDNDNIAFDDLLTPAAPYLALCGDIGHVSHHLLEPFLAHCSARWDRIFYVPGYSEFISRPIDKFSTMTSYGRALSKLCNRFDNVHYMSRASHTIQRERVTVIGTTLWPFVEDTDAADFMERNAPLYRGVRRSTLDEPMYRGAQISTPNLHRRLTVSDTNLLHMQDRHWLEREIAAAQTEVCVLTHTMPTQRLLTPALYGHYLNPYFASASDFLLSFPVRIWLAGALHTTRAAAIPPQHPVSVDTDGTPLIGMPTIVGVNGYGDKGKENVLYDESATVTVDIPSAICRLAEGDTPEAEVLRDFTKQHTQKFNVTATWDILEGGAGDPDYFKQMAT